MGRKGIVSVLMLTLSSVSFAQFGDVDVESARVKYQQASDEHQVREREHALVVGRWNRSRHELQVAQARLQSVDNELAELYSRKSSLESFLSRVDYDIEKLRAESRRLQALVSDRKRDIQTLNYRLNDKRNELRDIRNTLVRLERELRELEGQTNTREIREYERKLVRLRSERTSAESEAARYGEQARNLINQNSRLQTDIERNQTEMRQKRRKASELRDELQALKDARPPQIAERERLKQRLATLNERLKKIRVRIQRLEQEEGNENEIRQLRAEQREVKTKKDNVTTNIEQITRKVAREDQRRQTIRPLQARLDQEADQLKAQNQSHRQTIQQNRSDAQNLRAQRETKLEDIRRRIDPEIDQTLSKLQELRQSESSLNERIAELKREIEAQRRAERNVENDIRNLENQIAYLKREINDLNRRIEELEQRANQLVDDKRDAQISLTRINDLIPGVEQERRLQSDVVQSAQFDFNVVDDERRSSEQILATAFDKKTAAKEYLDQVQSNLLRAQAAAREKGSDLAQRHASQAAESVLNTGPNDGKRVGFNAGNAKGASEQPALSFFKGYQSARSNPDSESPAYRKGIQNGEKYADEKAKAETFPVGFNETMDLVFRTVPENDEVVVLGEADVAHVDYESTLLDTTPKSIGNVPAPRPDSPDAPQYELPRMAAIDVPTIPVDRSRFDSGECFVFPTPELDALCKQTYASNYDQNFLGSFENRYKASFAESFAQSAKNAYEAARNAVDPSIYSQGEAEANLQTGLLDGFERSLSSAQDTQRTLGAKAFLSDLDAFYFASIDNLSVQDQNQDGLLSPNERMNFEVSINNYGSLTLPTGSLKVEILRADAIQTEQSSVLLPAVAAQTRTTFKAVLPGVVKTSASAASRVIVKMLWIDASGKETALGQAGVDIDVKFPIELKDIKFGEAVRAGESGQMLIVLRNQSRKQLEIEALDLSLDARIGTIQDSDLPLVPPGETVELPVGFTPSVGAGSNQTFPFALTLKNVAGLADLTQLYNKPVPLKRNVSLYLCFQGFETCGRNNYIMPLKVKPGQSFSIPFILKLHVPDENLRGVSYRVERESATSGVKFQNNSLLGFTRSNLSSRYPAKNTFRVYIPSQVARGSKELLTFALKEEGTLIHSLTLPIEVL